MIKTFYGIVVFSLMIVFGLVFMMVPSAKADVIAQQPTVSIPTVTGTPIGPYIRVNADNDQINVRSGPGTDYDSVGVMIAGEVASALGRSAGGSWIKVSYPGVAEAVGWVYSPLVTLLGGGDIPVVEPPPTSTPRVTPTIDPTLASQFIVESEPTRLPTFTAPAPLIVPTFEPPVTSPVAIGIPMGLVIVVLGILGLLGALVSLIRGR
ncbi:MAG TPA: hypothetical protein DCY42_12000 [Chloroflexi bacterium]|nr:hypothetical protein [Chloroflexota bacterium]